MAENRNLNIILDLQDRASKQLAGFQGKLQKMQPAFKKMAAGGTIALGAIGAGVGVTTQAAAKAEGTWNKFNTVFGDGAEDMKAFVNDIRKEMPTATHEIARMAADMQDLLVPMGLARDKASGMSKGFLDVANKVAAFNDVDPTEVLEAIKSGLTGSSEPLKRFGVNALESSLEATALEEGLLKLGQGFKDLDPEMRAQVKAQTLLAQITKDSSDAIAGFEANNDSFIRRQQDMKASMAEINVTLGNVFLPIMDSILKKIKPVIDAFGKWAAENPKLIKWIVIIAGSLAALVTVLGLLGMAIAFVTLAMSPWLLIIGAVVLAVAALAFGAVMLVKHWDKVKEFFLMIWTAIKSYFIGNIMAIVNIITWMGGLITSIWQDVWGGVKDFFVGIWDAILENIKEKVQAMKEFLAPIVDMIQRVVDGLAKIGGKIGKGVKNIFGGGKDDNINDGIVQNGKVITTHPDDFIMAMKKPSQLAGAGMGGGGITVNISGNSFMGREDIAEQIGNDIMKALKQNVKL